MLDLREHLCQIRSYYLCLLRISLDPEHGLSKGEFMKVKDLIAKKGSEVYTGASSHTVKQALNMLVQRKVGALVIVDDNKHPVGIITEKDILYLADKHDNWRDLIVGEAMTKDPVIGLPEDDVEYIMSLMTINRFRHVPTGFPGAPCVWYKAPPSSPRRARLV